MPKEKESFQITSVCRDDLESREFDTSNVEDATMERLASKMADAYLVCCYWIALDTLAEDFEIPKKNKK